LSFVFKNQVTDKTWLNTWQLQQSSSNNALNLFQSFKYTVPFRDSEA